MEHHAVLTTCRALARRTGAELREVGTGKDGLIDLDALAEACTPEVGLVSVMAVNNEIGTVQPLERGGRPGARPGPRTPSSTPTPSRPCRGWSRLPLVDRADLVSVSAHKFGGPKGVGALVVAPAVGHRSPHPRRWPGAGAPERHPQRGRDRGHGRGPVRHRVGRAPDDRGPGGAPCGTGWGTGSWPRWPAPSRPGERHHRVAGSLHLRFAGVEGEALVVLLDQAGVAVSAGAACSSGAVEVSHVLTSMGLPPDEAASGIRLSLGATTTDADIDHALAVVPGAVGQLRD